MLTDLVPQVVSANGGNLYYSRNLRRLLLEAGFARSEGHSVAAEYYGTLEETRCAAFIAWRVRRNSEWVQLVLAQGWATADELEALRADVLAWGERPDAFAAVLYCAALGWVNEESSQMEVSG